MAGQKQDDQWETYIQQLCEDTGCGLEDLPEAMNDREKWSKRVRDIRAYDKTWWWWLIDIIPKSTLRWVVEYIWAVSIDQIELLSSLQRIINMSYLELFSCVQIDYIK